ncbi:hypothetical protein MBANPS3_000297 [Mucor bainieri]
MSEPNNQTHKPKKRYLTSRTRSTKSDMIQMPQNTPQVTPLKRRKRKLNAPAMDKPLLTERASSSSPPPTPLAATTTASSQPPAAPKRSLRAASQAIAKREKERQIQETKAVSPPLEATKPSPEKAPLIKKKRKLNTQKLLIPKTSSSQEYEDIGDDVYDKYLDSNSVPLAAMPSRVSIRQNPSALKHIPSTPEPKPAIVIGAPKKRKLGRSTINATTRTAASSVENGNDAASTESSEVTATMSTTFLDLSQHTIIPNESYVAHLPQSSSSRRRRSTTTESASTIISSSIDSVSSQKTVDPIVPVSPPNEMYAMDTYTTKSSPTIFYDAISDFEDMNLDDSSMVDDDAMMMVDVKEDAVSQQPSSSFWGSILKPFK